MGGIAQNVPDNSSSTKKGLSVLGRWFKLDHSVQYMHIFALTKLLYLLLKIGLYLQENAYTLERKINGLLQK